MTILRIGSNPKYADGWDLAFGGKKKSSAKSKKATPAKAKSAKKKKAKK